MAGYTRQSIASIINGEDITAPPLTAEFNQLADAFNGSTGHSHDGTTGNAPKIDLTTSVTGFLPAVHGGIGGKNNFAATTNPLATDDAVAGYAPGSMWENINTGRVFICVGNTSNAAVWRELVQIISSNKIEPIAHDTIDLGTPSVRFQDLYLSGGISASGNAAIGGTLNITGATSLSSLTASGTTTLNGDTDIGNANTDTVTITAKIDSDLIPSGTRDLGSTTDQWQNLYIDGTATVDTLTVDESATISANLTVSGTTNISTANITGGSIDGTPVGSTTTSSGAFTTLSSSGLATLNSVNIDGGAIDGTTIGASSHTTGKFTTLQSTGLATLNSVNIDGGAIDGTTIGATATSSGAFTTLSASGGITGNLTGNVTGNLTGDVTGDVTGDLTGSVTGNVTASSGTSTFNNVTINGNLDMDATSTATITNLSTPVNSGDAASKGYVDTSITNLIDGAPDALNTLNELAAALADDANAYTTLDNKINTKLSKAGDTMTGNLSMGSNKVTSSATPSATSDLTNKSYVDTQRDTRLPLSGGTMSGGITMGGNKITATYTPSANSDLTTKTYVDGILGSATAASTSATAAATSATNAATSESNAATSAAAASASEIAAGTSETNAASSASSASTSASNAATSESNASTSETNAASSASSASSSATAAANSATAAAASATAAAASESAASTSETNAAASASTAATEATKLTNSEDLPTIRPSLLLDFANSKTLDPRITFTRGSTATYWDGKTTTKAEENIVRYSQAITEANGWWNDANLGTLTVNVTTAPDGTTTASSYIPNTNASSHYFYTASLPNIANKRHVHSIYMKANGYNYGWLGSYDNIVGGYSYIVVNLTNGNIESTYTGAGASGVSGSVTSVGNGWYRVQLTAILGYSYLSVGAINTATNIAGNVPNFTGNGTSGIYVWGAQSEFDRTSATAYTPTTSSPIVKYQPTLQTAASGEARFDHDPVTGESKGLLIEEARTNLMPYSVYDSTNWNANDYATTYENYGIAPDGTQTATFLRVDADGTTQSYASDNITGSYSTTYTGTCFVKSDDYDYAFIEFGNTAFNARATVIVRLSDGVVVHENSSAESSATGHSEAVGNGWYRIGITATSDASGGAALQLAVGFTENSTTNSGGSPSSTGDGHSGGLFWGAQLEVGSFPTSYIPTSGSTVTRGKEIVKMTGANFSDWYNAQNQTYFVEGDIQNSSVGRFFIVSDGSGDNRIELSRNGSSVRTFVQAYAVNYANVTPTTNNPADGVSSALAIAADDLASQSTGQSSITTDPTVVLPLVNQIHFGSYWNETTQIGGHIKKFAFYPQRLSNATLQAMTEE